MSLVVALGGELGKAIRDSESARLKRFVCDENSEALMLFHEDMKDKCNTGDWYGEHVGKWLVSAALMYRANLSQAWAEQIIRVVDFLSAQQEESGYLGTYALDSQARFTHPGAENVRTWDIWTHAWMLLGLLEAARVPGCDKATPAAKKIGELLLKVFGAGRSMVAQGNHAGMSSLVIIEPLALMAREWNDPRYSELALQTFNQAVDSGLNFWTVEDASFVGTGKSYQLIWCLKGMLELGIVLEREDLIDLVKRIWSSIRDHHLTPMGGPWGGIATHKEVFNPPDFFDPRGLVETCSAVTWMILSHRMFEISHETLYLKEAEKTLYNSVLGAIDQNGADWCYFTFPNGRRNNTYYWACCKSSGAFGLAYASANFVTSRDEVFILWGPESCQFKTREGAEVRITLKDESLSVLANKPVIIAVHISDGFEVGQRPENCSWEGNLLRIAAGQNETKVSIKKRFQLQLKQHTVDHHGQEIVREEYVCAQLGRDVLATGKYEGYRTQETLRLPRLAPESVFEVIGASSVELRQAGRCPILLEPYWRCGGRHDATWRTTWMQVAWQ